jgi:hypothetical protein
VKHRRRPLFPRAGLAGALPDAAMSADITAPEPDPTRGIGGFADEAALLAMIDGVCSRVRGSLDEQRSCPGPQAESEGRGPLLVANLATRWGWGRSASRIG